MSMPAGWYDDPRQVGQVRWWDGSGWTDTVLPKPAAAAPVAFVGTPQQFAPVYMPRPQTMLYAPAPPTSGLAIAAFVVVWFAGIVGAILGHVALSDIDRTGKGGRGLAIAAIVIGWIGTGLAILLILLSVLISVPVFNATVDNSKKLAGQQVASQLATSITAWSSANGGLLPEASNFNAAATGPDSDLGRSLPTDDEIVVSYGMQAGHFCVTTAYLGMAESAWATYDGMSPIRITDYYTAAPTAPISGSVAECDGMTVSPLSW